MFLKVLVVIAVLILVYMIFFKKSREKEISQNNSKQKQNDGIEDVMVECPTCKTYVSKKESILSSGQYFCSKECLENRN